MRALFFFFNDTATTEIYTLSLHDALPISAWSSASVDARAARRVEIMDLRRIEAQRQRSGVRLQGSRQRSEEHTSELQSPCNLVCRLLLEKKKKTRTLSMRAADPALTSCMQ